MSASPSHRRQKSSLPTHVRVGGVAALAVVAVATLAASGLSSGGVIATRSVAGGATESAPAAASPAPEVTSDPFEEAQEVDLDQAVAAAHARKSEPLPDLSKMTLDKLQVYSAKIQAEFVTSSLAYEQTRAQSRQAEADAEAAALVAQEAVEDAAEARDTYGSYIMDTYTSGLAVNPMLQIVSGGQDSFSEFSENMVAAQQFTDAAAVVVGDFNDAQAEAETKAAEAAEARQAAQVASDEAAGLLDDIQERASLVAEAAALAFAEQGQAPAFSSAEQQARNDAALVAWRAYRQEMDAALAAKDIKAPNAQALLNPNKLSKALKPLVGANQQSQRGVAAIKHDGELVTVLPKETVKAVDAAFAALGKPYVAGNSGPETYDCVGLMEASWRGAYAVPGDTPAAQVRATQRVANKDMQVGDLVFFTVPGDGVQHVGLNLGGDLMVTADAAGHQVGVQSFPDRVFAATRTTLPVRGARMKVPDSPADAATRCGGMEPSATSVLSWPVAVDDFEFSSSFGDSGSLWSSGYHTGLDMSAPEGTPVFAAKAGVVTIEASGWAGPNHLIIDHGEGLQSAYAHMSATSVQTGDVVAAGERIGEVGSLGNSTGSHLHFEVLVDGVKVDPMFFLPGGAGGGAGWGGFSNGMIPSTALCGLAGSTWHALRCDAASAWNAMSSAYAKKFGAAICITDSYRSYEAQVTLYGQKPDLAAVPGTSNHGWAMAVDLCGGVETFSSPEHAWMVAHAPSFGWVHPPWAVQGGGREEPWHWEFGNLS